MNTPNGVYDTGKPGQAPLPTGQPPRYTYLGPFASNEERLTQQALQSATLPGAELQDMVRPPLPQIDPFPSRYGFDRRTPGIADIIEVSRRYTDPRVSWFSGGVAGYSGASRNSMGGV